MQTTASNRRRLGFLGLERLWQDVRYGGRVLAGSPGFATIAVLSLAIGIGANCAIFSFADALLLRPLPIARPGEVFTVGSTASLEALGASSLVSSYRDYVDIRDRARSFVGLAAFTRCDGRIRDRSQSHAQTQAGHAGQRQSVLADGCRAHRRTRLHAGRGSGARPRRRGRAGPHDVGAGVRLRSRRPWSPRADQRRRIHGDWRRPARVHGTQSVRPVRFLRAADDVAAARQRSETPGSRGPRRAGSAAEGPPHDRASHKRRPRRS